MAILRYTIFILAAVVMTGCYEDFTPKIDTEPVLCVNSLIIAGQPVDVSVTHTWLYTDDYFESDHVVSDAVISIYANGNLCDAAYRPASGDHMRIMVDSKTYGHAEAEVTVPHPTPIESIKWTPTVLSSWSGTDEDDYKSLVDITFNLNIELGLIDNQATDNYYRLSYLGYYHSGNDDDISDETMAPVYFSMGTFDYASEPIFSEHISVFESVMGSDAYGFTCFTDRQFSGSSYTLHLRFTDCRYMLNAYTSDPMQYDCGYDLTLWTVSQSYYYWANYLWQRQDGYLGDMSSVGLGDPLAAYSNVSTGAGVVAAAAQSSATIDLGDFIKSTVIDMTD